MIRYVKYMENILTTDVYPFKGILYNYPFVEKGDYLVSPPYDIITPEIRESLYEKCEFNIVRIDYGKDYPQDNSTYNRYTRAVEYLKDWLSKGILKYFTEEAFYLYEVEYKVENEPRIMKGIIGKVRITDLCKGVYPHEETHSNPKQDRLNLLRYCKVNLSPIFSLYNKPEINLDNIFKNYKTSFPYLKAKDMDGFEHRMWIIDNKEDIEKISKYLKNIPIYIADGHHRYETSLQYMKERQKIFKNSSDNLYNYVMMYLVNIADGGLTILPTHRLVSGLNKKNEILSCLKKYFDIIPVERNEIVKHIKCYEHAIGAVFKEYNNSFVLIFKNKEFPNVDEPLKKLDVVILHEIILKKLYDIKEISFEMDPVLALEKVNKGEYEAAFFLNPTKVEEIEIVAKNCLRMPPKSTFFYPKILTGFVLNPVEEKEFFMI